MSDTPEHSPAPDQPIPLADEPVAPPAPPSPPAASPTSPAGSPKGRIDAGSLLGVEGDTCPKCGAALKPGDVVCLRCGYDLKANVVRTVETGTQSEAEEPEDFVTPGGGSAKTWGVIGGILTVAAMIMAGINAPGTTGGFWIIVGSAVLALYNIIIHTGTGLVALAIATRIVEERFGRVDLSLARMFAAISLFELIRNVRLPLGAQSLKVGAAYLLAAGAYYLAVWGLFRKGRTVTLLVMLLHIVLWVIFQFGMMLAAYVNGAHATATP